MTYRGKLVHVHRKMYELVVGPIPEGLVPDHLCNNRACWRPDHLEIVTNQENLLRSKNTLAGKNAQKTHCKRNHKFTPENTRYKKIREGTIVRECITCTNLRKRAMRRGEKLL